MGLSYEPKPALSWYLRDPKDLSRLKEEAGLSGLLQFQADAIRLIRQALKNEHMQDKGLIGFVGGPLTLFFYAAEGSHQGQLNSALEGMGDGRFDGFCERLRDLLVENMVLQYEAGLDVIVMMDTCAGELSAEQFEAQAVPEIESVLAAFKKRCPQARVMYYSKGTSMDHLEALENLPINGIGIDWRLDLQEVLRRWSDRWCVQGNIDPHWLLEPAADLEIKLRKYYGLMKQVPLSMRKGWICGLGHGVIQQTPEANVQLTVRLQKELLGGS